MRKYDFEKPENPEYKIVSGFGCAINIVEKACEVMQKENEPVYVEFNGTFTKITPEYVGNKLAQKTFADKITLEQTILRLEFYNK